MAGLRACELFSKCWIPTGRRFPEPLSAPVLMAAFVLSYRYGVALDLHQNSLLIAL